MVTLPSCVQLMVLVTGNDQTWFKNLVKIWSEKIWSKSGQNLVPHKYAQKVPISGFFAFRTNVRTNAQASPPLHSNKCPQLGIGA